MPSRFSAAFRRKSATSSDDLQIQPSGTESSFRVLERGQPQEGRTFDGGAKMARASAHLVHKTTNSESEVEDNMFAGLKTYRGSGGSNTTKATSTDTSSRHSNASTAPSSADVANPNDDPRPAKRATTSYEPTPSRQSQKTGSSFLDRAGRTFSFGMQKKNHIPLAREDDVPEVPPLPMLQREDEHGRTRAMTASTTSTTTTATPPRLEGNSGLDMGGDFGSMFSSFDKRASQATLRSEMQRQGHPGPLNMDSTSPVDPSPRSWNSNKSSDGLLSSSRISPSLVPRHQPSFEYRASTSPTGVVDDEDARLLADSVAASKFLTEPAGKGWGGRTTPNEDKLAVNLRKPVAADESEDNMFAGTTTRVSRPAQTQTRPASPPRGSKVMTTAEFERYAREKNRQHLERSVYGRSAEDEDDEEEDINYDDEEDAEEKAKEAAKRSRNKQAQIQAYRQKNMKTTGGDNGSISPLSSSRPTFAASLSAPHLGIAKTPSPEPARPASDDDEDDEVPLAILQAHGFPHKNRAPSRLSVAGSNPNLRATSQAQGPRPQSLAGEPSSFNAKRSSTLPAFARGLPQDPFAGASASRGAVRESLSFAGGSPNPDRLAPQQPQHQPVHPGGLVGVIASEERARAMRRGSPNMESQKLAGGGAGSQNLDPMAGIPPHMMYGVGQQNAAQNRMSQQPLSVADQAQVQMSQQMAQFMQMQMQFMQMMASNQSGGQMPQLPMPYGMPQTHPMMSQQQQQPYGMHAATRSVADFSSGQSTYGQQTMQPRRLDAGSRTMSMVQPNTGSQMLHGGMGGGPAFGYTPSIAPSERSNVGLPGRYRPVSQAPQLDVPFHQRAASISGALSLTPTEDSKSRSTSTIKLISKTKNNTGSDDDDEEGWEAMRAKRDSKKSRWRLRKDNDH